MSLNVYGKITEEISKKIETRFEKKGLMVSETWIESLSELRFRRDDRYPSAVAIACRACGMKPTMRFSTGWGHYGTHAE